MDKIIRVTGFFDADGAFSADPWFSYPGARPAVASKLKGEYSVYVYSGEGKKIAATHFDAVNNARAFTAKGPVPMKDARIPIDVSVRLPEGAARIAVTKGELEIYSRDVPGTAPTAAFTGLAEGQELDGKVTLTWDASGAEGRELYFEIWYYPREDEFFKLATDVTGRYREINLSDCAGTEDGYFRIIVTDGINTADSRSACIRIPFRPPDITTIQKEIPQLKAGEKLFFKVNVYDKQDGWMRGDPARESQPEAGLEPGSRPGPGLKSRPESEAEPGPGSRPGPGLGLETKAGSGAEPASTIIWFLVGEEFGRGDTLSAAPGSLSPGTHTFTCTATNSHGLSASKEFTFEILDTIG